MVEPALGEKPGQDLLVQSLSGLTWLSGNRERGTDSDGRGGRRYLMRSASGARYFGCLDTPWKNGKGARIETSLLASAIDFQFEVLTTHLNDGGQLPQRSALMQMATPISRHLTGSTKPRTVTSPWPWGLCRTWRMLWMRCASHLR